MKPAANAELHARRLQATPRGVGVFANVFVARARNAELWDVQGQRYIDFAGGIGVLNTGHLHPKVSAAVQAQLQAFSHSCYQVVPYESYVSLAERLNALVPIAGPAKTAFFSTGAEAVENAIKVARAYTGRAAVIAFTGGFHGRTLMGMSLTGKVAPYKKDFGPFVPDTYHLPFPCEGVSSEGSLAALQALFKSSVDPERVAAIIIEPVQGEGGFHVAPPELLRALRALCDEHAILLIADEIQSGMGRTGRWFAIEHSRVLPDLITSAKSLAGGFPLAALSGRAAVMDAPAPGGLGGTYAGHPLALAAAHAVLDVIETEGLLQRAEVLGERLRARLLSWHTSVPQLQEQRGQGSMVAAQFKVDAARIKAVQQRALEHGLIVLSCGAQGNALRFLYPLTIEDQVLDEGLDILHGVLTSGVLA